MYGWLMAAFGRFLPVVTTARTGQITAISHTPPERSAGFALRSQRDRFEVAPPASQCTDTFKRSDYCATMLLHCIRQHETAHSKKPPDAV